MDNRCSCQTTEVARAREAPAAMRQANVNVVRTYTPPPEWLLEEAEAALDISMAEFRDWIDAERVIVNVATLYREFSGDKRKPDVFDFHARMARIRSRASIRSWSPAIWARRCNPSCPATCRRRTPRCSASPASRRAMPN